MAYRLRTDESVASGLRRVVKKELRRAIDALAGVQVSDDAIHDARKRIKKVRAVVQLVGQEIHAGRARKRLGRAGHLLAPLRDADAVIASARSLCARDRGEVAARTCAAVTDLLRQEKARLTNIARHDRVKARAARTLERVRRTTKDWDWKDVSFSMLAAEIGLRYKRARLGMREARGSDRSEMFHAWRKQVKTLWYGLRLLERRLPALGRRLSDLDRLERWLGDDHNLLVLRTQVVASRRLVREQDAGARLRNLAERQQRALRRRALAVGARVFKEPPKDFVRYLRQLWAEARHQEGRPPRRRTTRRLRKRARTPSVARAVFRTS